MSNNKNAPRVMACTLAMLASVSLAACGKDKAPSGQVLATVDGQEVTVRELRAEMGDVAFADPKQRKAAEQAALQSIVNRKILAKAAQEQKLDKSPDFALQKQRAIEVSLAQTLQNSIAKDVPASTREEAEHFIASHPNSFAERKIFSVDQIRTPLLTNKALAKRLEPLNSLDEVEALFTAEHVPYQRVNDTLDAATSDPVAIESILKLPAGSIFAVPQGNMLLISKIKDTRIEPFTGEPAIKVAMERLRQQHIQEAVSRGLGAVIAKAKDKVQYSKDYAPAPAAPKTAAAAKPAPSA